MMIDYIADYLIRFQKYFIYIAICFNTIALSLIALTYYSEYNMLIYIIRNILMLGYIPCVLILLSDLARSVKANYRILSRITLIIVVNVSILNLLTLILDPTNIIISSLLITLIICLVFGIKSIQTHGNTKY